MNEVSSADFWQSRYDNGQAGWDIGVVSPPLQAFFDTKLDQNKDIKILIAGAGNAHEAQYLHEQGYTNVVVVDFAEAPLVNFANNNPNFPPQHLVQNDFFNLSKDNLIFAGDFDYAIEQTFFCAIDPKRRADYVEKMHQLLKPNGKLVGLLMDCYFADDANQENPEAEFIFGPPFGGNLQEYQTLFAEHFSVDLQPCVNSHSKRQGIELFIECINKSN